MINDPIDLVAPPLQRLLASQHPEADKTLSPQLIVDHFSFEELHSILAKNSGQVLGCFDEMTSFYGLLDLYKHSSTMDRKTLLTLNGGGAWTRNFKSYSSSVKKTAFNVTGFIQPSFVFEMLHCSNDADGLNDRQLFDFPRESDLLLNELKVPMPVDTPSLKRIFEKLCEAHKTNREYTLEGDAYDEFQLVHDSLVREKLRATNENVQGILSPRLAMIIHCLEQTMCPNSEGDDVQWNTTISKKAVTAAGAIVEHFNKHKFIALGYSSGDDSKDTDISNRIARLLCMDSKQGNGVLKLFEIAQKHISEKVGTSYPIMKAQELAEEAEKLGFGKLEASHTPSRGGRTSKHFRKRPLEELDENCIDLLK